ncbi:DUF302 domain-containing protein [Alkalitalea saponilacus]|uniref:Uncharacterized conserved protein, DUF302 family n=1 Tax=Alkalitalea saponilacus TaxID=889453 RepID=A0A1T5CBW8_9BACT|nr:DUF302 domain-containing protein [Alkalitalea saponilacus]ASB49795.1 hypothetical protein CDL62_11955 [Alkalitalea saponilacus]SKB56570.1 Uncharacterized conserved protein, DUF302 family [Alkalitalea saponilacus]
MGYYFSRIFATSFDHAKERIRSSLKDEGFEFLFEIKFHEVLKKKLDITFKKYIVFGACNAKYTFEALKADNKIGTILPCNVIVQQLDEGTIEVAIINANAAMLPIKNKQVQQIAEEVTEKLKSALDNA